jgi:hypothetical protein
MRDAPVDDLGSLDRDVRRAVTELVRWRARLARDPEESADVDPIEPVRRVAGKTTLEALRRLSPPVADAPLRDALVRWVGTLTLARLVRDDDVAWARGATERRARFLGEPPRLATWREAWRGVVEAKSAAEARLWLETAAEVGETLAATVRMRAEKRAELATRLGWAHPWDLLGLGDVGVLRAGARQLLDATEDLARAVGKDTPPGAAAVLHAAVARDAAEGWPAHLTTRWLNDVCSPALGGLSFDLPSLPAVLGAASFARALTALGFAASSAAVPSAMPFALGRAPGARVAHRLGFVFGALVTDVTWQMRALDLPRRTAQRQARILARTALLDARLHAACLLLGDDAAPTPRDLYEELGARLFGVALDPRLRGAWPRARDDAPARFVALVQSLAFGRSLRDGFDADWFRNPRAGRHLRTLSAAPALETHDPTELAAGVQGLARAFEGALG